MSNKQKQEYLENPVYEDKIVLEIENYILSKYSFSESMVPVFDAGANGVGIKPFSENDLHVGDIVTFRQNNKLIVHRIIEKGIDDPCFLIWVN